MKSVPSTSAFLAPLSCPHSRDLTSAAESTICLTGVRTLDDGDSVLMYYNGIT